MSFSFEGLVRPFQVNVAPLPRVLPKYEPPEGSVTLVIGMGGSGKTMNGSISWKRTHYMDTKLKEQSLQTPGRVRDEFSFPNF